MKLPLFSKRTQAQQRLTPLLAGGLLTALVGMQSPGALAMSPEIADLNGDGVVNVLDFRILARKNGTASGTAGYREGMDLVPDGIINRDDLNSMRGEFRQSADNTPAGTAFGGRVFDGLGNALQGVKIFLGSDIPLNEMMGGPCDAPKCVRSDAAGQYLLTDLPADVHGETQVSFISTEVTDPTPGQLSGDFATIPLKPVFVNAGTTTVFRDMPLPERDLTGAQSIGPGQDVDATPGPDGLTLNQPAVVNNGMAEMTLPAGCTVLFPDGEASNQLSITRVPAASLPVAMPPGLSSTLFVTYQPGATEVNCPGGTFVTEFDNLDGFPITVPGVTPADFIPILNGIVAGVFIEIAPCVVEDRDGNGVDGDVNDIITCSVPTPFDFAWYHTDITPPSPCPRTTVIGQVKEDGTNTPVAGASVTIPGATPVVTDDSGNFIIPNVAAGPNGTFCFTRPFTLRANATGVANGAPDTSVSDLTPAVPGETTDLGMIFLGNAKGQVRGRVVKLQRINPELVVPLVGALVELNDAASTLHPATTDTSGNYNIDDVEIGNYSKTMNFEGDVQLPDGGVESELLFESQNGNVAAAKIPDINDFLLTAEGATVTIQVVEADGTPITNAEVYLYNDGGTFGLFKVPASAFDQLGVVDNNGEIVFPVASQPAAVGGESGIPMGPCTADIYSTIDGQSIGMVDSSDGCFVNEVGENVVIVAVRDQLGEDIASADVGPATIEDPPGVFTDALLVAFNFDVPVDPGADGMSFLLDFDLDKDSGTGGPGLIPLFSGHFTDLGVEVSWECQVDPDLIISCTATDSAYTDIDSFFDPESNDTRAIFLIPRANANGLLGIGDSANLTIGTMKGQFGGEVQYFDVVPNGFPDAPDFIDSDFEVPTMIEDPIGDVFEGFSEGGPAGLASP